MSQKISYIIFASLLLIILGMGYYMIFSSPSTKVPKFDEGPLRRELAKKDSIINSLTVDKEALFIILGDISYERDSIQKVKQKVIHHYEKQYKAVTDGTLVQLDSIIRSNWKL